MNNKISGFFSKYYCFAIMLACFLDTTWEARGQTITFSYSGTVQYWTVPAGVYSIAVDAQGATGGDGGYGRYSDKGGYGGRVQCTLSVTPGMVLGIRIGAEGADGYGLGCCYFAGGFNGGGSSGGGYSGGGGGATDIRIGGSALSNRVIVAAGGGGGGHATSYYNYERGGSGGGLTGGNGYISNSNSGVGGGQGATSTSGGGGGAYSTPTGTSGSSGQGGNGSTGRFSGGGGGGFYGGGGGSQSGGGGGSSYTSGVYTSGVIHTAGYNGYGNGALVFNIFIYPITGATSVCLGSSSPLYDATPGGTWISGNPAIASVGASTGVVTGLATGTALISYTDGSRYATTVISVNTTPSAILGTTTLCAGSSVSLSDAIAGGTWTSSNPAVASVNPSTGMLTGISGGMVTVTYTLPCGVTVTNVTVNPSPAAITGPASICTGTSAALSDPVPGGVWVSSNPPVASISGAGVVAAIATGSATISYSLGTGCYAVTGLTVNPNPAAITGTTTFCAGASAALSDPTSGGIWNSSLPSVASVNPVTGLVTGSAAGSAVITYVVGTGCFATTSVVINPLPAVYSVIGGGAYCGGAGSHVYLTGSQIATNYALYVGAVPAVTMSGTGTSLDFGALTMTGSYSVVATNAITACASNMAGSVPISIGYYPSSISGSSSACLGTATTLSDATGGGTWSSSNPAVALVGSSTGVVTGTAAGTATVSYNTTPSCYAITTVTILPALSPSVTVYSVSGDTICYGATATFTAVPAYGGSSPTYTWRRNGTSVYVGGGSYSCVPVNGDVFDVTMISSATCAIPSSAGSAPVTISIDTIAPVTGVTSVCLGATSGLLDATPGGTWSSGSPAIATIGMIGGASGVAIGLSPGTAIITYTDGAGCIATTTFAVNPLPVITATAARFTYGGGYVLTATGGVSYIWSPATGLSCPTCASTYASPAVGTTYVVTVTDINGCSNSGSVIVDANRISGYITYSGSTADILNVWLIQFNSSDSSITAIDSTNAVWVHGMPYYEFLDKPNGNYMVKASLVGAVPGTSGYVPTYGFSTTHWYDAASVAHSSGWDSLHINMVYGTVPPGPGFIGGSVSEGAGRGTTGIPVEGMIVYLYNSSNQLLTFTYTDNTGAYSFRGLADGVYYISPEEYSFATVISAPITLSPGSENVGGINFRKYLDSKVIKPLQFNSVKTLTADGDIAIHPNPTNGYLTIQWNSMNSDNSQIIIDDILGREVYRSSINTKAAGQTVADLSHLTEGVYTISIEADKILYSGKLIKR